MGLIDAHCGHKVEEYEDLVSVMLQDEDCDAIDGFRPCIVYHDYCPACAVAVRNEPYFLSSQEVADAWLHAAAKESRAKRPSER